MERLRLTDGTSAPRPRPRPDLALARFGTGVLLYEPARRRLHTLNTSAALVWRRLDGHTTLADAAHSLTEIFASDHAVIEGDVAAVVQRFVELGLLIVGDDPPEALPIADGVDEASRQLLAQLDAREWGSISAMYQSVGLTFCVRSEDGEVADAVARALRPLVGHGDDDVRADHQYSIRQRIHDGAPQWRLYFDGTPIGTVGAVDAAVALLSWHISQATVEQTAGVLFLRASAIQHRERVVILPGESGTGKSILATALLRRGCEYLADNEAGVDVAVGRVLPYPAAIYVDSSAMRLFPGVTPTVAGALRSYLDPTDIAGSAIGAGGPVSLVVSPCYVAGGSTRLDRVVDIDAVRLLLDNSFPFDNLGARGFHALVAIAQQASMYRLTYSDLDAACEVVLDLMNELN